MEPTAGENIHLCHYFVLLLDIMGQQEQLEKWSRLPPDGSVTPEMTEGIRRSLGDVYRLRQGFRQFYESALRAAEQCTPMSSNALRIGAGPDRERYKAIAAPEIKLLHFSDIFIAYAPAGVGPGKDLNIKALYAMLGSVCGLIPSFLAGRIPLRGAVCIGAGTETEEIGFYGPALSEAHRLESGVADYPRIVLSDQLRDLVQSGLAEQTTVAEQATDVEEYLRILFGLCNSLLAQDTDGRTIVDYLGHGSRELLKNSANLDSAQHGCVARAYEFVTREAERLRIAELTGGEPREPPRTSPAKKLLQLKGYFDRWIDAWRK